MPDATLDRALGRIEGKLELIAEDIKELKAATIAQDERIGSVERAQAHSKGIAAVLAIIFTAMTHAFTSFVLGR